MIKELLKNKTVDIYRLLLLNYRKLDIDEIELVMLMNLFLEVEQGQTMLKFIPLSQKMSFGIDQTTKKLQGLLNKGFIVINVEFDKEGKTIETFDLSPTIDKIERIHMVDVESSICREYIEMLEKEKGSSLSPSDINIVLRWKNYSREEVLDSFARAKVKDVLTASYIDTILKGQERLDKTVDEEKSRKIKEFVNGIKR